MRVANGARAPTLRLPAGQGELLLQGRHPGTREYLRASVDYDGIAAADTDQFNLVLQRLRVPDSELIEEQEIMRRVSVLPERRALGRAGAGALAPGARLRARCLPSGRIARWRAPAAWSATSRPTPTAADGTDLTDYDLIGDESARTGLFALRNGPRFEFLCVPPLGRNQDIGMATLLVAARLCRSRQALLVVDPPRSWDSAEARVAGVSQWAFHSEMRCCIFPGSARSTGCAGAPSCSPPAGRRPG